MTGIDRHEATVSRLGRRRYLQAVSASLVGTVPAEPVRSRQTAEDAWPQYAYDPANTAYTAARNEPRDDTKVDQQWWVKSVSQRKEGQTESSVSVVGDTVFVGTMSFGNGGEVLAYPTGGGEPRWRTETTGSVEWAPAVGGGTVYVTDNVSSRQQPDEVGSLYALDAATGEREWTVETPGNRLSAPILVDGTVVFTATVSDRAEIKGTRIYAVSAADGAIEWTVRRDSMSATTPAVADGTAYVGLNPASIDANVGTLYAYDLATGDEQPVTEFSYEITAAPTVADGTAYVGVGYSLDDIGRLYAVDLATGERDWRYDATRDFTWSVAVAENTVVLSSDRVEAIDRASGKRRWEFRTDFLPGPPTVAGETVYVQRDRVYAIDLQEGTDLWNGDTGTASVNPVVIGDTLYTVGYNDLYAFAEAQSTTPSPPEETLVEQEGQQQQGDGSGDGGSGDPILRQFDSPASVGLLSGIAGLLLGAGTAAYRDRTNGKQGNQRPPGGGQP